MEFPKENIIDKTISEFEKKYPLKAFVIRLKLKINFMYLHYIKNNF